MESTAEKLPVKPFCLYLEPTLKYKSNSVIIGLSIHWKRGVYMATAKVIFATITGNNEDVADIIIEKLEQLGVDVQKEEISQADATEFEDVDICVVVPYTYDEGALPEEGLDFYDDLKDVDLKGKIYGCAGSGDTFYEDDYCRAVTDFSATLKAAGATQGAKDVFVNLAPEADDVKHLDAFAEQLVQAQANQ